MISSGRLSDRKLTAVYDSGYCDLRCPFLHDNVKSDESVCFNDGKAIKYDNGFIAHCENGKKSNHI